MATVDMTNGTKASAVGGGFFKLTNVVDFDAAETSKGSALAANDIIQMLDVPANTEVVQVFLTTTTAAAGTALTANVGLADTGYTGYDVDGFLATASLKTAAGTTIGGGAAAYRAAGGFLFNEGAGTVDATLATVTAVSTNPVVKVVAMCFDASSV